MLPLAWAVGMVVSGAAEDKEVMPKAVMAEQHFAVFEKYCLDCHDADTEKGKVNLDELSFDLGDIESAELWQKILNALNSGEMPPEDKKQLTAEEKTVFLDDLSHQLVIARKIHSDTGGEITMRRLNRREYANTMRELLGVEVDVSELPDDANAGGFDTSGGALFFSSDQFERYGKIGREALDLAIVDAAEKPELRKEHIEVEVEANRRITGILRGYYMGGYRKYSQWKASKGRPASDFGLADEQEMNFRKLAWDRNSPAFIDYLSTPETETGALLTIGAINPQVAAVIPDELPAGKYRLRVKIGAAPKMPTERTFVEVGFRGERPDGAMDVIACRKVSGTWKKPQVIELEVSLPEPKNPLVEEIGSQTKKKVMLGDRVLAFRERQQNSFAASQYRSTKAREATGFGEDPSLWVDWLEWEGPLVDEWPPQSHRQIFGEAALDGANDERARKIIEDFATRAFRIKPPTAAYIDKLMALFRERRAGGEEFAEAIKEPLSVVLSSPAFLYLVEPGGESQKRELSDLELAVRLSYFLWSAPPDAELAALARSGKLSDPAMLTAQTNRLLNDPRSAEFVSGFAHQWLHMERLDFFQFNHRLYPQFDESVKEAARQEVYQTLALVLREKLGVGTLLKSDFVVINDLLADYYGIKGVRGDQFRKVPVPKNLPRGGLLGMAAILAMGSDGERSSPVERGAWVMRKLLHDPPPPAPANVPQISRLAGKMLPARELLNAHMEEAQCAQCHRKIDPLGYGLENFDAVGRWRDLEYTEVAKGNRVLKTKQHPIDAGGSLPDGTAFDGFFELRDRIGDREQAFAQGFAEALVEYGLGRPFGFSDHHLGEAIMRRTEGTGFQMREFIHALVQSEEFRRK